MFKIGLVDHHLNNYHSDKFLQLLHGPLAAEECRIVAAWESHPKGEADWCSKNGVLRVASAEEVARQVDAVMVMAPDDIEFHRRFCESVLPFGKPTFIDKFLAPNLADAQFIVDLARQSGTRIMSSSALAFSVELEQHLPIFKEGITEVFVRGFGKWEGYGVHTIAMAMRILGGQFQRLIDTGTALSHFVTLDYGSGKRATVEVREAENQHDACPWQFGFRVGKKFVCGTIKNYDGFYLNLMKYVVAFFKGAEPEYSIDAALGTVAVLELAVRSQQHGGVWVNR
ncbi:MAG: Gfo/Idh/MocA family oxidoreductase [bacterium]|nr:Gfo/Idh/MocA family oxidoreductase [bacterium]